MLALNFLKLIVTGFIIIIFIGSIHFNTEFFNNDSNQFSLIFETFLKLLSPFIIIYSICSIPFGIISHHIFKTADPRLIGSGNIGATNMMRTGSKKAALFTLLGDFLKGYLCCLLFDLVYPEITHNTIANHLSLITPDYKCIVTMWLLIPVIAHVFPVWLNFKGGKGIATAFGVLVAFNWQAGLLGAGIWLITFAITRTSSVAGITFSILIPVACYYFMGLEYIYWSIILSFIILFTHRRNILDLINGVK